MRENVFKTFFLLSLIVLRPVYANAEVYLADTDGNVYSDGETMTLHSIYDPDWEDILLPSPIIVNKGGESVTVRMDIEITQIPNNTSLTVSYSGACHSYKSIGKYSTASKNISAYDQIPTNIEWNCLEEKTWNYVEGTCEVIFTLYVNGTENKTVTVKYINEYGYTPPLTETGSCGPNSTYIFYKETGVLRLNGLWTDDFRKTIKPAPWDSYKDEILSIEVSDGFLYIGNSAFKDCENLISVRLASSIEIIGEMAFSGCTKLTSIELPENLTSIEDEAFYNCSKLTTMSIPHLTAEIGDNAFGGCTTLENVTFYSIPKWGYNLFENTTTIALNIEDDSYVYTGSNYNMPTCGNAIYTRSIGSSSWGTVVLPYAIASDENVQLYELSGVSGEAMTFSQVDNVAANTPCVFKKKNAAATSLTFAAADVNVTATAAPSVNSIGDWTVKGTYERLTDQTGKYYIAKDGFWYADIPISIKPFRAWFENSGSQAKAFSIFEQENDTEDAIQALEEMTNNTAEYYDLNGRRMDGLQKGINIIKYGQDKTKKVIIK